MSNVAILKDKINSGQTGDKVAFPDPAMAPLGTDEEAGGNTTSAAIIQQTIAAETVHARPKESLSGSKVMVAFIVVTVLCIAAAGYLFI